MPSHKKSGELKTENWKLQDALDKIGSVQKLTLIKPSDASEDAIKNVVWTWCVKIYVCLLFWLNLSQILPSLNIRITPVWRRIMKIGVTI